MFRVFGLAFLFLLTISSCGKSIDSQNRKSADFDGAAEVNTQRLTAGNLESGNWMSHGRTYSEQRHSPLRQISVETISDLGLVWSFDLDTKRGIESTSLVIDGVMYMTSAWSIVYALDAKTGKFLWKYDPDISKDKQRHACCDVVNRGVAAWQGKIFLGTLDGRLEALDALTGEVEWSVGTVDPELPYTITGAPRVINGLVMIGNGGAEFGVRGFIAAYDYETGEEVWKFYTVPGNPENGFENEAMRMASSTWTGKHWEIGGGGGTVWDSMAYDSELDLMYIGVGNGTPWNQSIRSPGGGDNLFLSSIVALRPNTGEYVWHYQTTPGETWDYTATQHIILADLMLEGEMRKILMQAPKNGFFYVLDRATGELLSANNYIDVNWATHVDLDTGRPVEVEGARYPEKPAMIFPSYLGGHNWHPMSFSPDTGLTYIPVLDFPAIYAQPENYSYRSAGANLGTDGIIGSLPDAQSERDALRAMMRGRLLAWNPSTNSEAWRVEYTGPWNGGTLSTGGGLVFQGTADSEFVAYKADSGDRLWSFPTQTGVVAAPMSYSIDDEQYISVNVGWGGAYALVFGEYVRAESMPNVSRVLTFKLDSSGQLPPVEWEQKVYFNPPKLEADPETIRRGYGQYMDNCNGCHGLNAVSGLLVADLRGSGYLHDAEAWNSVVIDGALSSKGMASFSELLSREESNDIRAYVIQQAWRGKRVQEERNLSPGGK